MQCALFCITLFLVVQNGQILIDILSFDMAGAEAKTSFVKLAGSHYALFLMLCNTLMILVFAAIDTVFVGYQFLAVGLYVPFILYMMNRIMEEKKEQLQGSGLAVRVVIVTAVTVIVYA